MSDQTRVRATALLDLPAVVLEAGFDPFPALQQAGIDPADLARAELTFPAEKVAWLLDGLAEQYAIPDLGIRIAMRRRFANLGVAGLVLGQQHTVREALGMVERYRHLMSDSISLHIEEAGPRAIGLLGLAIGASAPQRQSRELGLAAFIHLFRVLQDDRWCPAAVHFAHGSPGAGTLHRRYFGCQVYFESTFDGFEFCLDDLDRVNSKADPALAAYASSLLDTLPGQEASAVVAVVTRLIHTLLPMGRASIVNVAKAMGRNVRTLQRELAKEGLDFRSLMASVRDDLAEAYLRDTTLTVTTVSERLGYASDTAFIRAFRTRQGITPGGKRKQ